jgi:hypothetical protein
MLLIGSRAIAYHLPEFRTPRDWDLVGSEREIARLDGLLARRGKPPYDPHKAQFSYRGVPVEVANSSAVAYWDKVSTWFAGEPVIEEPVLGRLVVPPVGYLLLTKQCGLIYPIAHWHKNLEDLYFMRDRIPAIPEHVAALLPHVIANSRDMFAREHADGALVAQPCHPALPGPADPALHHRLHERLRLGDAPVASAPRAWEGFPDEPAEARRGRLIDLYAEETLVLAAERSLRSDAEAKPPSERQLLRWALRSLITGNLPEGLRYFGVNYYREILDRIPGGWLSRA